MAGWERYMKGAASAAIPLGQMPPGCSACAAIGYGDDMLTEIEVRRRRAVYRAAHRGTKEMDYLLGKFADAEVPRMAEADLERFEQLLALPDPELQSWLMGPPQALANEVSGLVADIRAFHGVDAQR